MSVHQLLPDFASGDAIGTIALQLQDLLREAGHRSEIYAQTVDPRVAHRCRPAATLEGDLAAGDAVVYHLSIGSPIARLFERLPARRLLYYHNITPPAYFGGVAPWVVSRLHQGRAELRRLVPDVELVMAPSDFNLQECRALGAPRTAVVPPPVDASRLRPRPARPPDPPLLLFVGRIAPNKGHADLLRVLAALRGTTHPGARLEVVGHSLDTEPYLRALRRLAGDLGVAAAVTMPGGRRGLSDEELGERYANASAYVCLSEHEGFCVPLLEAMSFSLPVVAYAAGAVPETVGDAGLLLDTRDPLVWAGALERVLGDGALREALAGAGRRRVEDFTPAAARDRLSRALGSVGIVPSSRASGP